MQIEPGLLKVAKAILDLKYVEMVEMAALLVASVKSHAEDGSPFDSESEPEWCELIRWWAVGYVDASEDA